MTKNLMVYWYLLPVTAIVLLDEWLKFKALKILPGEGSLSDPGVIAFAIHKNPGIAFDMPFRLPFVLLVSVIIGIVLLNVAVKNHGKHTDITASSLMIIIGALGNMYDRIVYQFTVDYIILFGRLAINLSDIVILIGVIWLLMASRRPKRHRITHPNEPS